MAGWRAVYATYDEFRDALFARHENRPTSVLSTVGDAIVLAPIPVGLATRSVKAAGATFVVGTGVILAAHLFQPGTMKDEVAGVFRHPVWALRAETARVLNAFANSSDMQPVSN
jgi:hypothetical protein